MKRGLISQQNCDWEQTWVKFVNKNQENSKKDAQSLTNQAKNAVISSDQKMIVTAREFF